MYVFLCSKLNLHINGYLYDEDTNKLQGVQYGFKCIKILTALLANSFFIQFQRSIESDSHVLCFFHSSSFVLKMNYLQNCIAALFN